MSNLIQWIEEQAGGENVTGVVIGEMPWGGYNSDNMANYSQQKRNVVLSWKEAKPFLGYEFDSGFGSPGCNRVTAWTKSWVICISQYDGATNPFRLPRNPVDHEPIMPGG